MTALEKLKDSNALNKDFNIPCGTGHNNPHIYCAYAELVLKMQDETVVDEYKAFWELCSVAGKPGLFYRWPNSSGGPNSHDEVMGASSISKLIAGLILNYLDEQDGNFASHGPDLKNPLRYNKSPLRYNIYRFIWLRPYLAACAGYKVGVIAQAIWCAKLILDSFRHPDSSKVGPGPRLRAWLMAEKMRDFPICNLVWGYYRSRLERKGLTLRHDLEQEPAWPALAELAPEKYLHPKEKK